LLKERPKGASREGIQCRTVLTHFSVAVSQAHEIATTIRINTHNAYVMRRKNITIREDQAEWVEENHLNLSSFVRGKLDELIEERS